MVFCSCGESGLDSHDDDDNATYLDARTMDREVLFVLDDLQGCAYLSLPGVVLENWPFGEDLRREEQVAVVSILRFEREASARALA